MKKLTLTLLSTFLLIGTAHAGENFVQLQKLQNKAVLFFLKPTLTEEASQQFLKGSFTVEDDTFNKNASIIHSTVSSQEYYGMPLVFAFNEGQKIVGIAGSLTSENVTFFKKLATSPNLTCKSRKADDHNLVICAHNTAQPAVVSKFTTDFIYLMKNAG